MRNTDDNSAGNFTEFSAILERMQDLVTEAYYAGQRQAKTEFLKLATDNQVLPPQFAKARKGTRAKRGTSRELIKRALTEGAKTVREISAKAKSDEEKRLSTSALYLELMRGKKEKRYANDNGAWSLATA
jgi:hypothetical protein